MFMSCNSLPKVSLRGATLKSEIHNDVWSIRVQLEVRHNIFQFSTDICVKIIQRLPDQYQARHIAGLGMPWAHLCLVIQITIRIMLTISKSICLFNGIYRQRLSITLQKSFSSKQNRTVCKDNIQVEVIHWNDKTFFFFIIVIELR